MDLKIRESKESKAKEIEEKFINFIREKFQLKSETNEFDTTITENKFWFPYIYARASFFSDYISIRTTKEDLEVIRKSLQHFSDENNIEVEVILE